MRFVLALVQVINAKKAHINATFASDVSFLYVTDIQIGIVLM